MKKVVMSVAACALLMPSFATAKDQTFTGEIIDSQCAKKRLARDDVEERGHGRQGSERSHDQEDVYAELCEDGRKVRLVQHHEEDCLRT
jgi:hypothetical protein